MMTPEDVRGAMFPHAWHGYDRESVDVFLDSVEEAIREYREEIERLQSRIRELTRETERLRKK